MLMSWLRRRRRGHLGWLGRIEGVEKPALLLGFGMVLYRVWRSGENGSGPGPTLKDRWRVVVDRVRRKLESSELGRELHGTTDGQEASASAPP